MQSSVSKDNVELVKLRAYNIRSNPNFNSRCGCDSFHTCSSLNHGKSYINVDYNYGIGPGKYIIKVGLNRYGGELYGFGQDAWMKFSTAASAYKSWRSYPLTSQGNYGRGGYFFNGTSDTPGPRTGTLGVEVIDKVNGQQVGWTLWYFDAFEIMPRWGNQWFRCGQDYDFWFEDNI